MKKTIALLLAGMMVICLLSACGENQDNTQEDENKPLTTSAECKNFSVEILDYDFITVDGSPAIIVYSKVKNISDTNNSLHMLGSSSNVF